MSTFEILLTHAAITWFLTGLIWTVQIVHYPLFAMADRADYPRFAAAHGRRITPLVAMPMVAEAAIATWLVVQPPPQIPVWWTWGGLGLVALIWLSTALLQVPMHGRLSRGFETTAHTRLVRSNWIRTVAWSIRSIAALAMLTRAH